METEHLLTLKLLIMARIFAAEIPERFFLIFFSIPFLSVTLNMHSLLYILILPIPNLFLINSNKHSFVTIPPKNIIPHNENKVIKN